MDKRTIFKIFIENQVNFLNIYQTWEKHIKINNFNYFYFSNKLVIVNYKYLKCFENIYFDILNIIYFDYKNEILILFENKKLIFLDLKNNMDKINEINFEYDNIKIYKLKNNLEFIGLSLINDKLLKIIKFDILNINEEIELNFENIKEYLYLDNRIILSNSENIISINLNNINDINKLKINKIDKIFKFRKKLCLIHNKDNFNLFSNNLKINCLKFKNNKNINYLFHNYNKNELLIYYKELENNYFILKLNNNNIFNIKTIELSSLFFHLNKIYLILENNIILNLFENYFEYLISENKKPTRKIENKKINKNKKNENKENLEIKNNKEIIKICNNIKYQENFNKSHDYLDYYKQNTRIKENHSKCCRCKVKIKKVLDSSDKIIVFKSNKIFHFDCYKKYCKE